MDIKKKIESIEAALKGLCPSCFVKKEEPVVVVEEPKKSKNTVLKVFAIIGVVAAVVAGAYALYRYLKPDYLEDYEGDFEDDYFDEDEESEEE